MCQSVIMPAGIQVRGPHQFRAQVRRKGVYQTKTFEKLSEAQEWRRVTEGKVTGEELIDLRRARSTLSGGRRNWMPSTLISIYRRRRMIDHGAFRFQSVPCQLFMRSGKDGSSSSRL
jgi:hypothetical protein